MLLFHALIVGLALYGCFVGHLMQVAEELCHSFVDAVGLPLFPADFEEGVVGGVVKREEVVSFDVGG
jgi:hypothetical protein